MADNAPKTANVPSITGNPVADTVIAGMISGSGGLVTGATVGWLNAHGFNDPNLYTYIFTGVTGTLASVAIIIWRALISKQNVIKQADEVIHAVATGEISDKTKKIAVAAPTIPNEKIMTAVVNADEIKQRTNS